MSELYLPVLSHFENGNTWIASIGTLRYKIAPTGEELRTEIWEGPWCYELSRVEAGESFPLTEEGIEALRGWLLRWGETINARPAKSLAETLERRDAQARASSEAKE